MSMDNLPVCNTLPSRGLLPKSPLDITQNFSMRRIGLVPFIHWFSGPQLPVIPLRIMGLIKGWMKGFWTRSWLIPWQVWSLLRVVLENSCLWAGRRNEEETRVHCLSKCVSSPTASITMSMMSCGLRMSIDFAICLGTCSENRWPRWARTRA